MSSDTCRSITPPPLHSYETPPGSPYVLRPISKQLRTCSFTPSNLYDAFGFQITSSPAQSNTNRLPHLDEWRLIVANWHIRKPSDKVLKHLFRSSIPPSIKGFAWLHISGAHFLKTEQNELHYSHLLSLDDAKVRVQILKDVDRTMPGNSFFSTDRNGLGRQILYNVLAAFSASIPSIGYTQGMAFICAVLLLFMPEFDAFCTYSTLMNSSKYRLLELFKDNVPLVKECNWVLSNLIEKYLPNLFNHFNRNNVTCDIFATSWFLTLFVYSLPFPVVIRIWDLFIFEGWKVVFRVALGILTILQDDLLKCDFITIIQSLQHHQLQNSINNPDLLIETSLNIKLKTEEVVKLQNLYKRMSS
ncbi:hypothetical protein RCL1_000954 [Eukaryota sp. TZLM3-RCL]